MVHITGAFKLILLCLAAAAVAQPVPSKQELAVRDASVEVVGGTNVWQARDDVTPVQLTKRAAVHPSKTPRPEPTKKGPFIRGKQAWSAYKQKNGLVTINGKLVKTRSMEEDSAGHLEARAPVPAPEPEPEPAPFVGRTPERKTPAEKPKKETPAKKEPGSALPKKQQKKQAITGKANWVKWKHDHDVISLNGKLIHV